MKKLLGATAVCLLAVTGCGGSNDPDDPTLTGPATIDTVAACLDSSDKVHETYVQRQSVEFGPGIDTDYPPAVSVSLGPNEKDPVALVSFLTSGPEAETYIIELTAWLGRSFKRKSILEQAKEPSIVLQYERSLDANLIEVLYGCTTEPD